MSYLIPFIIYVFSFALILLIGTIAYKHYKKEKFIIFNFLPSELEIEETFPYFRIFIALFTCIAIYFHADFFLIHPNIHEPFYLSFFMGIIFILSDILLFPLFIIKTNESVKKHVIISSTFLTMHLLSNLLGILYIVKSDTSFIVGIILFAIIFVIQLILLCLKDLKLWTKLEKKEENGEIIYVRGRNSLAIREWIFLFSMFLSDILFIVFRLISEGL